MRNLFLFLFLILLLALPASAVTVDRIAAVVDQEVVTVSEVSQMAEVRFFSRVAGQNEDDYRRAILDALIAQALRLRDVERFGAAEITADRIEARLQEIQRRFASAAELETALIRAELTLDELRALVRRQLQVDAYIQERFEPLIFVTNEDIESYFRGPWAAQRRERGLPPSSLPEVREEIRALLRGAQLTSKIEQWTSRLRLRANVDVYAWR